MQIDLASAGAVLLDDPAVLETQVCVVGGGIAGLVLADRLATAGVDVVVLEAGGAQLGMQEVELAGEPHVGSREGRPRALGGSSLVWGGQLLPMLPGGAWPLESGALDAYGAEINRLLGVDARRYEWAETSGFGGPGLDEVLEQMPRFVPRWSKFAPFRRRNLATTLGKRLREHAGVRVLLHAKVTELRLDANGQMEAVEAMSPSGQRLSVRARCVVVAAGTVETCRLLLASRSRVVKGVGNEHGQVGRNFHDHLTAEIARFEGGTHDRAVQLFRPWVVGGVEGTLHALKLEADDRLRRRLGVNFALAHITFEEPEGSGVSAVKAVLRRRQRGTPQERARIGSLLRGARDAARLWREARSEGRRYVSGEASAALRLNVAQAVPNRSRVVLAEALDRFGQPLARVEWEHAAEDLRTLRVMSRYLQGRFGQIGFDGLRWNELALPVKRSGIVAGPADEREMALERPWPGLEDARHAMGGGCMGTDPRRSVVDPELRVHGVENLYLASAAVFPDGRPHLPTWTLMALTLRLADHLVQRLRP